MKYPYFKEHDTELSVWVEDPNDPKVREIRDEIIRHLRRRGFRIHVEAQKKHYRCIAKNYHLGAKGDLKVALQMNGRVVEILFYQDVVCENRNGGRYDFRKLPKMPYLVRLQYMLERKHLAAMIESQFRLPLRLDVQLDGMEKILRDREESHHECVRDPSKRSPYNIKARDGLILEDGMTVFWCDSDGRVRRGEAWYDLSNNWWILLPCGHAIIRRTGEIGGRNTWPDLRKRYFDHDRRERGRKRDLRLNALKKLSPEEIEVLGIKV